MKKIILLTIASLAILSCKQEPKDYLTFSGKITNKNSDSLLVWNPMIGFKRVLQVDENGVFKDTMKIVDGLYSIYDGKESTRAFFRNGDEVELTLNAKEFDESIVYAGSGVAESNFLAETALLQEAFLTDKNLFQLSKEAFDAKVTTYTNDFETRITAQELDSTFVAGERQTLEGMKQYLNRNYEEQAYIAKNLAKGMASPKFNGYENHKGGSTSLDDLKGKYVYIDMWATWCQPCKNEIPYLKKVEKQFHDKNIEFVSISIDRNKDYKTWREMVVEKELTGIQLYAKEDKAFTASYRVSGIPRFILLDAAGNIVDSNAPRPSDPKLVALLSSLDI